MASEGDSSATTKTAIDKKPKDPHRVSAPFVPPNPYDIMPPGADEKQAVPANAMATEPKRDSQYIPYSPDTINPIEQDPNQLPQVVIEDAPEVVGMEGAEGSSTSPIVDATKREGAEAGNMPGPNGAGSSSQEYDADGHDEKQPGGCMGWVKNRSKRSVKLLLVGLAVVAVIIGVSTGVAVVVANKSRQGYVDLVKPHGADGAGNTPSSTTKGEPGLTSDSSQTDNGTSSDMTSSTNTHDGPSPTSSAKPATDTSACKSEKSWFKSLNFVSTADTSKMPGWQYAPVSSPEDCCMACYTNSVTKDGGCLAWLWNPYVNGDQFRCTNYQMKSSSSRRESTSTSSPGDNKDKEGAGDDADTCPAGHEKMVFNDQAEDVPDSVGGVGPCGEVDSA